MEVAYPPSDLMKAEYTWYHIAGVEVEKSLKVQFLNNSNPNYDLHSYMTKLYDN